MIFIFLVSAIRTHFTYKKKKKFELKFIIQPRDFTSY